MEASESKCGKQCAADLQSRLNDARVAPHLSSHEMDEDVSVSSEEPDDGQSLEQTGENSLSMKGFQSDDLHTLADYAGRVAHDFNNTIQVLLSGVQFVLEDDQSIFSYESHLILNKVVDKLKTEGDRVRHMLDFSGRKRKCFKRKASQVNLCLLIEEVLEHFKCEFEKSVADRKSQIIFETQFCKNCMVSAETEEIRSMMMCLLTNAGESMPNGGKISVCVQTGKDSVILEVADEGCGVDPKDLTRMFQPYWTTKNDKQRGIGLSTVYCLVKALDGTVTANSQIGKGTRISIYLPLSSHNKIAENPRNNSTD